MRLDPLYGQRSFQVDRLAVEPEAARVAQRVNAELLRRAIVGLGAILAVWFALRVFL